MNVIKCDDLFKLRNRGIVASCIWLSSNDIKISDTIWVIFKGIYFMSKVIGIEQGHNFAGIGFTAFLLDEDTVPKKLIERK